MHDREMNGARMGHIGDNPQEVEFEPMTAPSVPEPITAPTPAPEEVPAGV